MFKNPMYIIPVENIEDLLDYKKIISPYIKTSNDIPKIKKGNSVKLIHEIKEQKSIINKLLVEKEKNLSDLSNLYNYIISLESNLETYRMDNMDYLIDSLNILENNNKFLDNLISSFN